MSKSMAGYVFRRIGGHIVPIRAGAVNSLRLAEEGLRGVSRKALRVLDALRNKKSRAIVEKFTQGSSVKNIVFHGTDAKGFKSFSHSKIGQRGYDHGRGFYFTKNKFHASGYGKKVNSYYLNIKKPLIGSLKSGPVGNSITMKQVEDLAKGQDLSNWDNSVSRLKKSISKDSDLDKIQEIGQTVYHNDWKKALSRVRKVTGIDGSISSSDNKKIVHYVAYNSDQIMKAPKKSQIYKKIQGIKYRNKK